MKLIFKLSFDAPFEQTLALGRYQRFWDKYQNKIIQSFKEHTGLTFQQKQVTVKTINEHTSRAGNTHKPMELNRHMIEEVDVGGNLIHELSHRLVIGNGIDTDSPAWNYHCHRHIYLFLYDVWVDVLGKKAADKILNDERNNTYELYRKAWNWALAKTYKERQKAIAKLREQYPKPKPKLSTKP